MQRNLRPLGLAKNSHRRLSGICKSRRCSCNFLRRSSGRLHHIADDGLPSLRDREILHVDCLLGAAPIAFERIQLSGIGSRELVQRARSALPLRENSARAKSPATFIKAA